MKKALGLVVALAGLPLSACTEMTNRMVPHAHEFDAAAMLIVTFSALAGWVAYKRQQRA